MSLPDRSRPTGRPASPDRCSPSRRAAGRGESCRTVGYGKGEAAHLQGHGAQRRSANAQHDEILEALVNFLGGRQQSFKLILFSLFGRADPSSVVPQLLGELALPSALPAPWLCNAPLRFGETMHLTDGVCHQIVEVEAHPHRGLPGGSS